MIPMIPPLLPRSEPKRPPIVAVPAHTPDSVVEKLEKAGYLPLRLANPDRVKVFLPGEQIEIQKATISNAHWERLLQLGLQESQDGSDPYKVKIGGVVADPYLIARAYGITDPAIFQAIKKLLRCGRKHKDIETDIREAITSLERWEEMNTKE